MNKALGMESPYEQASLICYQTSKRMAATVEP